jgi:hypothetical protein
MRLAETYAPRPIRPLGTLEHDGWRLKVYGIAYSGETPSTGLTTAAARIATQQLPFPAVFDGRYGVGFLGVHAGRGADFVFVDWWEDENELHHHVFVAPAGELEAFEEKTSTGLAACVWDLAVICFERRAWLETVLANPAGPDLEGYMARRLDAAV